jgi:polynucleotide 5'-kinase involved in rRNA processing
MSLQPSQLSHKLALINLLIALPLMAYAHMVVFRSGRRTHISTRSVTHRSTQISTPSPTLPHTHTHTHTHTHVHTLPLLPTSRTHHHTCPSTTPGTVLIGGGKDTGKSTLARWLINKLLDAHPEVMLVDLDCGQTEFGPPGIISVTTLRSPVSKSG